MPRARDPNREKAFQIYKENAGKIDLIKIARILNIPPGTVRGWKAKDKWEQKVNGTFQTNRKERSKRKRGAQPGNQNSKNAAKGNKRAEKHGFYSRYIPAETLELLESDETDPLEFLWENILLARAAIIRAQKIAFVKNEKDYTARTVCESDSSTTYSYQEAWDKQANFMTAQSRAQRELAAMIKQYDEMVHKDWDTVTDTQKARLALIKTKMEEPDEQQDDGFIEALEGKVDEIWQEE